MHSAKTDNHGPNYLSSLFSREGRKNERFCCQTGACCKKKFRFNRWSVLENNPFGVTWNGQFPAKRTILWSVLKRNFFYNRPQSHISCIVIATSIGESPRSVRRFNTQVANPVKIPKQLSANSQISAWAEHRWNTGSRWLIAKVWLKVTACPPD